MEKNISENRWLPPSPHKEEVLKRVEAGRAHIEERGHNIPPLLVFEDGGVIELPKVRYMMTHRGMELIAADDYLPGGQTKHNDVCGTIDELKGLLKENPDLLKSNPDHFNRLLDDACYMTNRMQKRRENYREFATEFASLCERMAAIEGPETKQVHKKAEEIRAILQDSPETVTSKLEEIYELAEGIRDVANNLESCLSAYKKVAIEVGGLYENIKGGRNWKRK
ncbi:hypothetical protein FJZ31_43585 [Candidatus Poribacteria bacterium]|nr:hypothetical protein [Candidatus Poribacteria bacterium]